VLKEIIKATEKENPTVCTRNVLSFLWNFMVDFRICHFLEINSQLSAAISTQNDKMCVNKVRENAGKLRDRDVTAASAGLYKNPPRPPLNIQLN
jgi:hypothetical protein